MPYLYPAQVRLFLFLFWCGSNTGHSAYSFPTMSELVQVFQPNVHFGEDLSTKGKRKKIIKIEQNLASFENATAFYSCQF